MGLALYGLAALGLVLGVGWLLYVAPTPGPLSPMTLLVGLLPAIAIVGGVLLMLVGLRGLAWCIGVVWRVLCKKP